MSSNLFFFFFSTSKETPRDDVGGKEYGGGGFLLNLSHKDLIKKTQSFNLINPFISRARQGTAKGSRSLLILYLIFNGILKL